MPPRSLPVVEAGRTDDILEGYKEWSCGDSGLGLPVSTITAFSG